MATSEDRKDNLYIPNFWHTLVQVVVRSRHGEKSSTVSKSPCKGSSMFNIELEINEGVTQEVKKATGNQALTSENPFSIEILLQTKDGEIMALEVWTLKIEEIADYSPQKMDPIIIDRLSVLLKSSLCTTRISPAYKLSFRQGSETYVLMYKLYTGPPNLECLGEQAITARVGVSNIHTAHLSVHLSYRTQLSFPSPPRVSPHDLMMLKSDHFKIEASPKHCRRSDRVSESSENAQTSDESQEKIFNMSPMDMHSTSIRSRTSSESSNKGAKSSAAAEKIYVPFASQKPTAEEPVPNMLFSNLLLSTVDKGEEFKQEIKERKERRISETGSESKFTRAAKASEKQQMNTSDHSTKSFSSTATREDDYVVVDLKTPFVGSDDSDAELSTFFKECQTAPQLQMFSEDLTDEKCIEDQLKEFEDCADSFDELVKSLHSDNQSSEELG